MQPEIQAFFDPTTRTISYVVYDKPSGHCAIIDPVLDYDPKSGRTKNLSADVLIRFIKSKNLTVDWILETHAHADHLSSMHYLKSTLGGKTAIGSRIPIVQQVFKQLFNLGADFQPDGSQFDHLFDDGDTFEVGQLQGKAIFVPGHTPADLAYQFADTIFIGDTTFMPDVGTARADFPGGNAQQLYRSIRKLLDNHPAETRLFMCHDYPPNNRPVQWESTVADERTYNIHVHDGISEDEFVATRTARDATLEAPVLILPSIQLNVRAGQMPPPENNGTAYFKVPINML
ncbi:metallo-beta-lactamase superfamily protein [Candidatus Nitrosoglobus terrae]|uniref:Metallo-beta-lactamase superfamily protein n=1 Tax=Candidatus Nitrosoglobus terrae TaxID=1630141 RepID=A0A1Q2SNQ7_9GAMM|nr:MBL fold metallo-hydrolase [Candidatus Nitrosoglobus terrae]BAW80729.1 metallo-beta-lactamase superfamily protein [Candidatus Nitrosoglobus terrae]